MRFSASTFLPIAVNSCLVSHVWIPSVVCLQPNEIGDAIPEVDLGTNRTALQISCGVCLRFCWLRSSALPELNASQWDFCCVLLDTNGIKCWVRSTLLFHRFVKTILSD